MMTSKTNDKLPMSRDEFEAALRAKGDFYHTQHPYHIAMYDGKCTPEQIRGWVANRFYYQISIPVKDAAIMANCPDRDTRAQWVQRIIDHDGAPGEIGGIEAWLRLGEAVGLHREDMLNERFSSIAYLDMQGEAMTAPSFKQFPCYVFGNEARGVPLDALSDIDAQAYTIPGSGKIDSLNLASAVTLALFSLQN